MDRQGIRCVTAGDDQTLRMWSVENGECENILMDMSKDDQGGGWVKQGGGGQAGEGGGRVKYDGEGAKEDARGGRDTGGGSGQGTGSVSLSPISVLFCAPPLSPWPPLCCFVPLPHHPGCHCVCL